MTAPKKSNATITRDEWLRALNEATGLDSTDDQSALTQTEYAHLMGVTVSTAHGQLAALVRAGKATRTKKWAISSYGRRLQYIAYKLT